MIARNQRDALDHGLPAMTEGDGRKRLPERPQHGFMRNASERKNDAELGHARNGGCQEGPAGRDFRPDGLFSGGTQRTALVMRQSVRLKPSSRCSA